MPNTAPPPVIYPAYLVRAFFTEVDGGHIFGPFTTSAQAEACVIALASRPNVIRALIEVM